MAELTCPQCKRVLDENYYCIHCCNTFPPCSDDNKEQDIDDNSASDCLNSQDYDFENCEESSKEAYCDSCGARGVPGEECMQCGKTIPNDMACASPQEASINSALLIFPDGSSLELSDGQEYLIGRESDVIEIKNALCGHDNISREHCNIRVSYSNNTVVINDNNSTNGTYVEDGEARVINGQAYPLPINIWLGHKPSMRVKLEIKI